MLNAAYDYNIELYSCIASESRNFSSEYFIWNK